jgi:hypothetical protein
LRIGNLIEENDMYRKYHISLEHYIISTGLAEMIKGSAIFPFIEGVWGCEFIEEPIKSNLGEKEYIQEEFNGPSVIKQIAYVIDNTSKTRALFEINKGANKHSEIDVNAKLASNRRLINL